MLSINEFSVGSIGHCVPLSLMLRGDHGDSKILIGGDLTKPTAFLLSGIDKFRCFGSSGNEAQTGLIVHDVSIEVDPESAVDLLRFDAQLGSLIRSEGTLSIHARGEFRTTGAVPVVVNLPKITGAASFGFLRWTVGLGSGRDRRILHTVDVGSPENL